MRNTATEEQPKFKFEAGDEAEANKEKIEGVEVAKVILPERVQQHTVEQIFRHAPRCGATPGGQVRRRHGSQSRKVPRQGEAWEVAASVSTSNPEFRRIRVLAIQRVPGTRPTWW